MSKAYETPDMEIEKFSSETVQTLELLSSLGNHDDEIVGYADDASADASVASAPWR